MMRDPLAAELMGRGTYSGRALLNESFVPISPAERDMFCKRLEMDRLDQICTSCGSTKPMTYYQSIKALSCCEARKMVPVTDYLAEMDRLRAELTAAKAKLATLRRRQKARRKPT